MCWRYPRSLLLGASLAFLVSLSGCTGTDLIGKTVPVTGKIMVDGKPLASGTVNYVPDESKGNQGKALGIGQVSNGDYTIRSTSATGDKPGVPPGWYKVTVVAMGPPGADMPPPAKNGGKTPAEKAPKLSDARGIAAKFANARTTPLQIEVKEDATPDHYELKATSK
jgi:hypothetical protein